MSIKYVIEPNALTSPQSYKAVPLPSVVLDYDSVAEQINLYNPTIPAATAKTVLEGFRSITLLQLSQGNTINLTGFVSMVVSLPGKIDLPTDTFPLEDVTIKAKASVTLRDEIRQDATFEKEDYVEKSPNILTVGDTNTEIQNYARDDFGLSIVGSNIGFDPLDTEQGVFILNGAGTSVRQEKISLNNPSLIIITPTLPAFVPSQNNVELTLYVATKYTENGQLRTSSYPKQVRGINIIEDGFINLFVTNDSVSAPVQVSSYTGGQVDLRIVSRIRTDNVLVFSCGTDEGVFGPEVEIPHVGPYTIVCPTAAVGVTVVDFTEIYQSTLDNGRYLQEIINLSPL